MAKELPYFKFEPNQWENGNVQICSREDKGLFVDLCSMYWSRLGDVPFKLAVQKLCNGNATAFDSLIEEKIFAVQGDFICIDFLNEQLEEFKNLSKTNSDNAREGWVKRRKNKSLEGKNATASKPQSEIDGIREEKKREDKSKEELERNFINWFNQNKKRTLGKKGRARTLTSKDLKNLKKLKESYSVKDFDHAFKFLCKNQWAIENSMITPTHFLVNANFLKYFQMEEGEDTQGIGEGGVSMLELYDTE